MTGKGNWLARTWQQRGLAACLLWPLSILYGLVSSFHRGLYRFGVLKTERCAVPVIVIGNIVAGGAGKTPLVIALAKHLHAQGLQVGVVSRGYGRHGTNCLEVLGNTPVSASGDEPALILKAQPAPVFVAPERMDAVNALLAKYPTTQVIISDDGLQHHSMARDIEVTVFDDRGVGNGWLLPAGPLRERWTNQRKHGLVPGLVLHTGQSPAFEGFTSTRRLADHALNGANGQVTLSSLKGQELTAVAGIANPDAFFDMLKARGLQLKQTISLPDHFDFSHHALPVQAGAIVLCTEKDAVKLFRLNSSSAFRLLAVPLEFAPEPAFLKAVEDLLAPMLQQPP